MRDADMVAAMMSGDQAGLAAAYDRYAAALYTYCRSLLMDPAPAADAVQATFLIAVAKLGQLQEPHRLQSWLYAIARNECHRQLRDRAAVTGRADSGNAVTELAHVVADAERSEPAELVRTAIAGLDLDERDVTELSRDRDLDDADLAALLGMPRDQVHQVASRARKRFEESLGTLLIASAGRELCPGLRSLLAGWDGQREDVLRASLSEHMELCPVCCEGTHRPPPRPTRFPAPGSSRRAGRPPLRLVTDATPPVSPDRAAPGQGLLPGAWDGRGGGRGKRGGKGKPGGPAGETRFPTEPPPPPPGRARRLWVAAVGLAVLAVLGAGTLFLTNMPRHAGASPARAGTVPGIDVITPGTGRQTPAASPGSVPSSPGRPARAPGPPRGSGSPAPRASTAPAPSVSPSSHSPAPPPARGTLAAAPRTVTFQPGVKHGPPKGSFRLTAKGGRVPSFTVTVPAAYAGVLTVTPGTGSLRAGQSVVVHVTLQDSHRPRFTTQLTVRPGALAVRVVFRHGHGG